PSKALAQAARDRLFDGSAHLHLSALLLFRSRNWIQASVSHVPDALHSRRGLRSVPRLQVPKMDLWICRFGTLATPHDGYCAPGTVGLCERGVGRTIKDPPLPLRLQRGLGTATQRSQKISRHAPVATLLLCLLRARSRRL